MANIKQKVNRGIDQAAEKGKDMAGKAIDRGKDMTRNVGQKMKDAGQKMKEQGR